MALCVHVRRYYDVSQTELNIHTGHTVDMENVPQNAVYLSKVSEKYCTHLNLGIDLCFINSTDKNHVRIVSANVSIKLLRTH